MDSVPETSFDQLSEDQLNDARKVWPHFEYWKTFADRFPVKAPIAFARIESIASDSEGLIGVHVAQEARAVAFGQLNDQVMNWLKEYEITPENASNYSRLRNVVIGTVLVMVSATWCSINLSEEDIGKVGITYPKSLVLQTGKGDILLPNEERCRVWHAVEATASAPFEITVPAIILEGDRFKEDIESIRARATADFNAELNKAIEAIKKLTGNRPRANREAIDTYIRWRFAHRKISDMAKPSKKNTGEKIRSGPQYQLDAIADVLGLPGRGDR